MLQYFLVFYLFRRRRKNIFPFDFRDLKKTKNDLLEGPPGCARLRAGCADLYRAVVLLLFRASGEAILGTQRYFTIAFYY